MNNNGVTVIIPTINEIDGVKWFLPRLKKEWYDELLIVDGGSTDGTIEYCKENGYHIFVQSKKGLPNAYEEAYLKATKDIIVIMTPDGSSLPEAVPVLVKKIRDGSDMVIASRYISGAKSYDDDFFTAIGNKTFTAMINILFRSSYTDTLVGFRALTRDAIIKMELMGQERQGWLKKRFFLMNSWETSSSIRAAKLKLRTAEIPADEPKRIGGERKLSIIRNGTAVLLQILHEFFCRKHC